MPKRKFTLKDMEELEQLEKEFQEIINKPIQPKKKPVIKSTFKAKSKNMSWSDYIKQINKEFEKDIEKIKIKESLKSEPKFEYVFDINNNNYRSFNSLANKIQIEKVIKERGKNNLLLHQVKFYDEYNLENNGIIKLSEDNPYYDENHGLTYIDIDSKKKWYIKGRLTKTKARAIRYYYCLGSDLLYKVIIWILNNPNNTVKITTKVFDKIEYNEKDNKQVFKNNIEGTCFYDGILSYFLEKSKTDKNAKANFNKMIKRQDELKKSYTLEEIKLFCEDFKISVIIKDYITGDDIIINQSKLNKFSIKFLNTKYNHLDRLFNNETNIEYVNKEQLDFIKKNELFYIESRGNILTLDKTYKKEKSNFDIVYNEWFENNNLSKLYINDNSDVYKLLETYDFNIHRFFNEYTGDEKDYKEFDLKKAYYNYSNKKYNKFYLGVPSGSFINFSCDDKFNIDIVKKQVENKLVGFYQVKIKTHKKNINFDLLGFTLNSKHTLFLSMILLLSDYLEFEFINCSIAPSVDIPFNEKFLEKDDNIKYYCKAYGLLIRESNDIQINIKPLDEDKEFYKTFHSNKYDVFYNEDDGLFHISIKTDKKSYCHIGYSIHSYTTTLILNELLKMDLNNVLGVKLDSIVLKKDYEYNINKNIFGLKNAKLKNMFENDFGMYKDIVQSPYKMETLDELKFDKIFTPTGEYITSRIIYFGGMCGTGKTSTIFNSNIPKKNICYTTRAWELIQNKKNEHNDIIGLSIPKLTGYADDNKCKKINNKNIKIIIQDEMTLSIKTETEQIIDDYYYCFVFLLGDINENGLLFQCSIKEHEVYKPNEKTQFIKFTKTYRFENDLNDRLLELRKIMEQKIHINILKLKFMKLFKDRYFNIKDINFDDDDIGICHRDDTKKNNELTNLFINKGAKPQYFIKKTNLHKNELRGKKINNIDDTNNYEMKLFKTVHSFQGRELKDNQKIIIYTGGVFFDYSLLYTAVSRAKRLNQIYLFDKY
jgi:hypothetical protein